VAADSAYTASLVSQIDGPVLLAGHSYGGAVISNAATSAPNVVGLVFVAAFAPDEGERLGELAGESKDSILGTAQVQYRYPAGPGGETAVELGVNPARLREVFAADLSAELDGSHVIMISQPQAVADVIAKAAEAAVAAHR
jgi:pimeloyl-ACP methyl ester carboxylesterase